MVEKWNKPGQHFCWIRSSEPGFGDAIDDCAEDDQGRFWASNGEYGSQVNYCPVCGAKAPTPVKKDKFGTAS